VSLNHLSGEAGETTDILGQIKIYSDKQHQPEYQQIFLISHVVEKANNKLTFIILIHKMKSVPRIHAARES